MSIQRLVGYVVSTILFLFGMLFAWASVYNITRLIVSIILFTAGFGILILIRRQQPKEHVQRLEIPGRITAQDVRCPNCSASLDMNQIKIVQGTVFAKCAYCGHSFELIEEPKW